MNKRSVEDCGFDAEVINGVSRNFKLHNTSKNSCNPPSNMLNYHRKTISGVTLMVWRMSNIKLQKGATYPFTGIVRSFLS